MPEPRLIYLDPIDPLTDRLLRLWDDDPEAPCAAQAIANRLQRTCSKNTVFRAAADGMPAWPRGPRVVLSSCIVQGVRMTSYEAVAAFLAELARVETERGQTRAPASRGT
jgi:hypothetical protein